MRKSTAITATAAAAFLAAVAMARPAAQAPTVRPVDETALREYAGVYQWGPNAFVYLQLWDEFTGFGKPRQLVAFDESGEVRTLYPADRNQFFAGSGRPGPAPTPKWRRCNDSHRSTSR